MTSKRYRILALLSCIGMFLVLVAGVIVTNTQSGRGCGTDWPLCNGKFVPAYTLESMIEYSHRAVSGLEGILVFATFVAAFKLKPNARDKEALIYSGGALAFTIAQAILGMMAVIWPTSDAVLAIHFGISMIAFTFTWLLSAWSRRRVKELETGVAAKKEKGALVLIPSSIFRATVAVILYCYAVVYLGAYVRHTDSAGGCIGWPLCNGEFVPEINGATGIVFLHRLAGVVLFICILLLLLYVRKKLGSDHEIAKVSLVSFLLVLAQVLSGWLLTATLDNEDAYVFTSLLHTIIVTAMFSSLCLGMIRAWQLSRKSK
ncbi:heme A synthase [Cohnella sp. AR92]|uniref:COX15/CtaA family protein n=1 Tax=Cohnella sp. AR92 TaxID=648716 RepID=UPI000F8E4CE3|nr:COX15/CtaA family protein [Cohnella sp. AR92]RUS45985.1 heme A synthase [Cohnella sp. AR92]